MEKEILQQCKLQNINAGVYTSQGWILNHESSQLTSINPANEYPIAHVTTAAENDVEIVIHQAKKSFQEWSAIPAPKRGELIREIANLLREHKDALGSLIALEMGKIKAEGDGEVQEMIDIADFAVGQSRMLYGLTMQSERAQHRMYEQWHPLGIIGVITAFNFPMAVWAWNAFIAAICGNVIIWKPSSKTPLCAIAVMQLCHDAMENCGYSGVFSLLASDDRKISEKILQHQDIKLISFTGSSTVGHHVAEVVAKRFGRYLLECSGNNAIIVDKSADLSITIPAIVFGSIGTAGQRCTSTRRLFIHHAIYNQVITALKQAYAQITIGDPLDVETLMGPLIDEQAVTAFDQALHVSQQHGGEIIYGGKILPGTGYYVEPTIISAENYWPIVQQETFAPILYVMSFKDIDEAIALQNDVPQGLSSAIFTNDLRHSEKFLSAQGSDCGIANVNIGTSGAEIGGAFGGEKETGGGREAGSDVWKYYMRRQTNTINWSHQLSLAQGIKFNV